MLISFLPHGEATYFHPPKLAYLIRLGACRLQLLAVYSAYGGSCMSALPREDSLHPPACLHCCTFSGRLFYCRLAPTLLPSLLPPLPASPITVLFGCGTLLALTAYRVLGSALSLLGGLASISCSLLLPTAFYSLLSWRRLRLPAKAGLTVLLAVGVALVGLITSSNLCDLLESCRERHSHGGSNGSSGSSGSSWLPWVGPQAALLPSQG